MALQTDDWEQVGPQRGTRPGGVYLDQSSGKRFYVKDPASDRQGKNEVLASHLYDDMGFNAVDVHLTEDGRVASEWVEDLPDRTRPEVLTERREAFETFLPSALIANWDVVGLEYDNMLPDPNDSEGVILLDFGGSFDTRAMGGRKQFEPESIPSLDGFLDPSLNASASKVFSEMSPADYRRSKSALQRMDLNSLDATVRTVFSGETAKRRTETIFSRYNILVETDYKDVFGG